LTISNQGTNTLVPINAGLGTTVESIWGAGETKIFNITTNYSSTTFSQVELYIPPSLSINAVIRVSINGFKIGILGGFPTAYDTFLNTINNGPQDWYNFGGHEKPFTFLENRTANTITLISKNTGVPLDVETNLEHEPIDAVITATTKVSHIISDQIPLVIDLFSNSNNGTTTLYEFSIQKPDYKILLISGIPLPAFLIPQEYFLITSYSNILRAFDDINNVCVYTSGVTDTNSISDFNYPLGDAYVLGAALLANTTPTISVVNTTNYGTVTFDPQFITLPFTPISCSFELLAPQDIAQQSLLIIPQIFPPLPITGTLRRSFDFRNSTLPFTTYSRLDNTFSNGQTWYNSNIHFSSSTIPDTTYGIGLKLLLDTGYPSSGVPPGPVSLVNPGPDVNFSFLTSPDTILITSKVPGTPFEIITNDIAGLTQQIRVKEIIPNQINGVSVNASNNYMGGFRVTPP